MSDKVLDYACGEHWQIWNADTIETSSNLPENTIDLSIYSPPFSSLYTYSNSERDLGNCKNDDEFRTHYNFLIKELLRITRPGRLTCVHCMDLPTSKTTHGFIGLRDFGGEIIRAHVDDEAAEMYAAINRLKLRQNEAMTEGNMTRFENLQKAIFYIEQDLKSHPGKHGWIFHSKVVIWKDPVTAMQRTKALGLLHKQVLKDSCMSRMGIPDYVVMFRKPGDNEESKRVTGPFRRYVGEDGNFYSEAETETRNSINIWQRYASPVWLDINPSETLQRDSAREDKDERHICPLQLQVIERCIQLWSNPGDVVYDPFAGIGSTMYQALLMGRKALGVELKPSYFKQAAANCAMAVNKTKELKLNLE